MIEEKTRIIPMTYDKMFKSVLTSIEARDYLSEIISDITHLPKRDIKRDMIFKNTEHSVNSIDEKRKISDLVVDIEENVINLEMNKDYYDGLIDRNHEYIMKIRENLINEGKEYKDLKKVIQINFDNYNIYKPDRRVIIKFEMADIEGKVKEGVGIESYHVILPNVKEKYYNEGSKDKLVGKLVIMMAENSEELERIIRSYQDLRPIGEKVVEISKDKESSLWYDEEEHKRKVNNTLIRMGIEKGWAEAREKGIKEGVEQGRKKEQIKIAKNLLNQGIDKEIIMSCTHLSSEELDNLK